MTTNHNYKHDQRKWVGKMKYDVSRVLKHINPVHHKTITDISIHNASVKTIYSRHSQKRLREEFNLEFQLDGSLTEQQLETIADKELFLWSYVNSRKFLASKDWKETKEQAFDSHLFKGRCSCCFVQTKYLAVDHILDRRCFPLEALNQSNLQIICKTCNYHKPTGLSFNDELMIEFDPLYDFNFIYLQNLTVIDSQTRLDTVFPNDADLHLMDIYYQSTDLKLGDQ
jgi:hypothetical protein